MHITCFEHQALFREHDIPAACFDWLLTQAFVAFQITTHHGKLCLKARQYVGVIATPFGTQIEILPKISQNDTITTTRTWLTALLNEHYLNHGKLQKSIAKQQQVAHQPIHQWLIQQLVYHCERILRSGVTSHYQHKKENDTYLRGKLNVADNIRQNQSRLRQHQFAQTADVRKNDSAENRMLVHALHLLVSSPVYQSLVPHMLYQRLMDATGMSLTSPLDVPSYQQHQFAQDVQHCQHKRLLPPYQSALPLAQLLLSHMSTGSGVGQQQGISLLFNMQLLFEKMVARTLQDQLTPAHTLVVQHAQKSLLTQCDTGNDAFHIRPDMVVFSNTTQKAVMVIDAKWKRIQDTHVMSHIHQADVYQMLAYATAYYDDQQTAESLQESARHHENKRPKRTQNKQRLKQPNPPELTTFAYEKSELETSEPVTSKQVTSELETLGSPQHALWLVYPQTCQFSQPVKLKCQHRPAQYLHIIPFDMVNQRLLLS